VATSDLAERPLLGLLSQLAAAAAKGQSAGVFIQTTLHQSGVPEGEVEELVENCLLANWRIAHDFGLLTPENLERMQKGTMPLVTAGSFAGKQMALIQEPQETGRSGIRVTYRLVPSPLQGALAAKAFEQKNLESGGRPVNVLPISPSNRPGLPGLPGQGQAPSGFRSPYRPATVVTFDGELKIRFIDVAVGEAVKLEDLGGGTNHLHVNSADTSSGIKFSIVDPNQVRINPDSLGTGPDGLPYASPTLIANTRYYQAAWRDDDIPETSEKGTFLTTIGPVRLYFVDTFAAGQNRFRIAALYHERQVSAFPQAGGPNGLPPSQPDRKAPSTAAAEEDWKVRFIDVAAGEPVPIEDLGGGRKHFRVYAADQNSGIGFSVADTTSMGGGPITLKNENGISFKPPVQSAEVKRFRTALRGEPIPGTNEKGTYLTTLGTVRFYFVETFAAGQNKYRIAAVYRTLIDPMERPATPGSALAPGVAPDPLHERP
jgi:hypothetical protein